MRSSQNGLGRLSQILVFGALPVRVFSADILKTSGFTSCLDGSTIQVTNLNIEYNRAKGSVTFDVAGTSAKVQNVTASLTVSAYGNEVYKNDFNPCATSTKVDQLCPGTSSEPLIFSLRTRSSNDHRLDSPRRLFLRSGYTANNISVCKSDPFYCFQYTRFGWRS